MPIFTYNKLEDNHHLSDKTELFKNVCNYYHKRDEDPFLKAFPLTFNITHASDEDEQFLRFKEVFRQ